MLEASCLRRREAIVPANRRPWGKRAPGNGADAVPFPSRRVCANQRRRDRARIASPERHYRRYPALAREACPNNDTVEMENLYQYTKHYLRVMSAGGTLGRMILAGSSRWD